MKKNLFFFAVLFCLYSVVSIPVLAINEEGEEYIAGYEDGWIEGYNEAEKEHSDDYDNGYQDGYVEAEKEIREQLEEDAFYAKEIDTSEKHKNLLETIKEIFINRKIILAFVGFIVLIINHVLLYYNKISSKLYTIIFVAGVLAVSFNFIF